MWKEELVQYLFIFDWQNAVTDQDFTGSACNTQGSRVAMAEGLCIGNQQRFITQDVILLRPRISISATRPDNAELRTIFRCNVPGIDLVPGPADKFSLVMGYDIACLRQFFLAENTGIEQKLFDGVYRNGRDCAFQNRETGFG